MNDRRGRNDQEPVNTGPTAREQRLARELRAVRANQVSVPGVGPVGSTGLVVGLGLAGAALFLAGDDDGAVMSKSSGSMPSPNGGESYREFVSRCMEGGDHSMKEAAEAWNAEKS